MSHSIKVGSGPLRCSARDKAPNRLADGTVMRIDEKALVLVRLRLEMSGEMDFPHMFDGEFAKIRIGVETVIDR